MRQGSREAPQSMTGYGRATKRAAARSVSVELRSTNHRYLEIEQRWPNGFAALQGRLVELVRGAMRRGRVEVTVSVHPAKAGQRHVALDEALLARYYEVLIGLKGRLGLKGAVTLDHLLALPQVIAVSEARPEAEPFWGLIRQAAEAAVRELVRTRRREGGRLVVDIRQHIRNIEQHLSAVKARLPKALEQQRRQTRARLVELLGSKAESSTVQLEEAVALIREVDVHEELVRLDSHLAHIRQTLVSDELIGKRLDFIVQELMREANTLGAKVADAHAARHVVDIKGAIERIREQAQNLE